MLKIGKVLRGSGAEGELLVSFSAVAPGDIDLKEPVYIFFEGTPVPFFFGSFHQKGNSKAVVSLTGVRSLRDAEELRGLELYADYFEEDDGLDFTGWTLEDAAGVKVGTIEGIEPIPGNPCLIVDTKKGQSLVPLAEDLVLSIDEESETLRMSIPDGLLE